MNPFTETQLNELDLQTLIFNYMASGIQIPSDLIVQFKRSLFFYPLHHSMSGGKKVEEDSEPWRRCKRTDGKKWRCSKEAFQGSKYCERHMHRGKKSSRKLVENLLPSHPSIQRPSLEFSRPNTNIHLLLGRPSYNIPTDHTKYRYCNGVNEDEHECYNFFSEHKEEEKQEHCYVLGADLMMGNPLRVERQKEVQKPKTLLCLLNECVETEEANSTTQHSISIL